MIRDPEYYAPWEREHIRSEPQDFHKNPAIMEAMMREAVMLGVFPPRIRWKGSSQRYDWQGYSMVFLRL